jgi:hypothetical protein
MTDDTETQKLAGRFESLANLKGMLDVKFYFSGEASSEQVCEEVNRLYQAVDKGEFAVLDFKDSYRKAP